MSLKNEKISYFMDKILPEFVKTILAALLLVFATWLGKPSTSKTPKDLPFSFGINKDLALLIYFLVLLYALKLLYTSLKNLMISIYDSKQLTYTFYDLDDLDFYQTITSSITTDGSFLYQVRKGRGASYNATNSIGLIDISNPKCAKDNCLTELVCTKTSFGRYKYRCPFCNNKTKGDYDIDTCKEQVRLIERKEILLENIEKKKQEDIEKKKQEELKLKREREELELLEKFKEDPFDPFGLDPFAKK